MTRVEIYLFKNSLKMILTLLETPSFDNNTKTKIKEEIEAMLRTLDRGFNQIINNEK